jgi:hypothetical protein
MRCPDVRPHCGKGRTVKQKIEGALYPDEVAVAAAAFQAALAAIDGTLYTDPNSVRRCLAEYISAHALMGELDVNALRDDALRFLQNVGPPAHEPRSGAALLAGAARGGRSRTRAMTAGRWERTP